VVRHLLRRFPFRRAARVLEVGCGRGELVSFLRRRGIEAYGIDDVLTAEDRAADAALHYGSFAGAFPFPPHHFDLILVREARAYSGQWHGPEAYTATANLLSALRPRRRLVFLEPAVVAPHALPDPARIEAIQSHLAAFPATCDARPYRDGLGRFLSLEWLLGRHRQVQLAVMTFTVPRAPVSRLKWHQLAREAVLRRQSQAIDSRAA
jgi:SAM-dependent methyltransferase